MKHVILNGIHRPLERHCGTLKHFVGENQVYNLGDILFVSTRNNEDYDVVLYPDGKKTFLQLWADKDKQPQPSGGGELGPNTVGTDEIINGSIQKEDLSPELQEGLDEMNNITLTDEDLEHMFDGVGQFEMQPSDDPATLLD